MEIFRLLAHDIESGRNEYVSTEALKKLYTEKTGKTSNIHKYYVIRWDEQSNLIPAHLFKDGLRHIHPDPKQSRTITVREAARLQTFDDDYDFIGSNMETYKMIGNAVPPRFAKCLAEAVYELLMRFKDKDKTYEECRINNQNVQISISSKRVCENMEYYLKKCGHQELGSVNASGKAQRGRYLLTSMNTEVLSMFPPLSTAQMNDSALLPIIPLYSGKKVYCNYVYHNDKFHGSSVKHPRNEYRLYLNKAIEENRLLFKTDDIIIIRPQTITAESNDETDETIYYLDYVQYGSSELYRYLNDIISTYPINGGYGLYEGVIDEFEEKVSHIANPNDCEVEIDDTVMKKVTSEQNPIAELFTAASFRDFVMVGYENLCAITNTVIRYGSYMNLEAAHIRPKSHGGLFLPNNGMALCRDLHWAFDKGFFTLDDNYRVIVHPKTSSEYLQQFDKKQIRLPKNNFFIPDLENIKYHQNNVYGLFLTTGRL